MSQYDDYYPENINNLGPRSSPFNHYSGSGEPYSFYGSDNDEPWDHHTSADSGYASAAHPRYAALSSHTPASIRPVQGNNTDKFGCLRCLHPGCEYLTKRQYDLDRHSKTHFPPSHEEKFDCPARGCGSTGEHGFDRKDHLREHLRKVHAKDIPKLSRRRRDPPGDIGRGNAHIEATSELNTQGENHNVCSSGQSSEPTEDMSRHQKPLELPEAIMDLGDRGMPRRSMRLKKKISAHTHPVGLPEDMAKIKDAAQMNTLGNLVDAVDDQSPHLAHDAQANIKLVHMAPQCNTYVMSFLSLSIELRVSLERCVPFPTIHISTNVEKPLEDGKQRIRWTCRCGRRLYDDFEELRPGALEELEQMLNEQDRVRSPEGNGSGQRRGSSIQALWNAAGGIIRSLIGSQPLPNDNVPTLPLHQHRTAGQERYSQSSANTEGLFLLMCIPYRKHGTKLVHMDLVELVSDETFFRKLKHEYQSIRGQWASHFSLWKMAEIQFVKFGLHKNQLIDIKEENDLPPASLKNEYRYQPIPAETIPPIGTNHLMHLYEHPDHADDVPFCLERIPKKIREQLKLSPHQAPGLPGWRVYFGEGFNWPKFWVFGSVILSLSVLFGVCWSTLRQDIQGGFGVTACMMVAVTFTTGVVQAAVEQT